MANIWGSVELGTLNSGCTIHQLKRFIFPTFDCSMGQTLLTDYWSHLQCGCSPSPLFDRNMSCHIIDFGMASNLFIS